VAILATTVALVGASILLWAGLEKARDPASTASTLRQLGSAGSALVLFLSDRCGTCRSLAVGLGRHLPPGLWVVLEARSPDSAAKFIESFELTRILEGRPALGRYWRCNRQSDRTRHDAGGLSSGGRQDRQRDDGAVAEVLVLDSPEANSSRVLQSMPT
jgi:hypothetical protein